MAVSTRCASCGNTIPEGNRFCPFCGSAASQQTAPSVTLPLSQSTPAMLERAAGAVRADAEVQQFGATRSFGTAPVLAGLGLKAAFGGKGFGEKYGLGGREFYPLYWVGYADRATTLRTAFIERLSANQVPNSKVRLVEVRAPGLYGETRQFIAYERGIASTLTYFGAFGNDLYVSLRAFRRKPLSLARMIIAGLIGLVLLFLFFQQPQAGLLLIGLAVLIAGFLAWRAKGQSGDWLAILRGGEFNEFHDDDQWAIIYSTEKTLTAVINEAGLTMPSALELSTMSPVMGRRLF